MSKIVGDRHGRANPFDGINRHPFMDTSTTSSPLQSPRELTRLLLGHYGEMALPVGLALLAYFILPRQLEWLALLPLGGLYGAAAARMLDVRREPLLDLYRQRFESFVLALLIGIVILVGVFIGTFVISQTVLVFLGGRHRAGIAGFAAMIVAGFYLLQRHWPRLGAPFVYDGLVDDNGKWTPPPFGPLQELLQSAEHRTRFTAPVMRAAFMFILPYLLVVYGLSGAGGWGSVAKIAFVAYLMPMFMLSLVQLTRDLAAAEGSWVEAAEVVEAPPALQHAVWSVEDDEAKPVEEERDDGSDRRVKVYDLEKPASGEAQYTEFGAQKGGPSPTPPGVAAPAPAASPSRPASAEGPVIDFPSAADSSPAPATPPAPIVEPPVPAPPAPQSAAEGKTAKDFALDELETVEEAANETGEASGGAMLDAVEHDNGEEVRRQVSLGANPNALDAEGRPLLMRAVERGAAGAVEALLGTGANPDERDSRGRTPLMAALAAGRNDLAEMLLHRGANPRGSDRDGLSTLMIALGALASAPDGGEFKSLADAPIIRRLLNAGADAKAANRDGETALHIAARRGDMDLVNLLFYAGADVNTATADGTTPLMEAVRAGHDLVAGRLRMWGAKD